jgi:hypothetical protein
MKSLRLALAPADGTHLYCIACGGYRTEYAIVNGGEPQSGIHKKCVESVRVKRVVNK